MIDSFVFRRVVCRLSSVSNVSSIRPVLLLAIVTVAVVVVPLLLLFLRLECRPSSVLPPFEVYRPVLSAVASSAGSCILD